MKKLLAAFAIVLALNFCTAHPAYAAGVAFDNSASCNGSTSPVTCSITTSGSNEFLALGIYNNSGTSDVVTVVTVDGNNMTLMHKGPASIGGSISYLYDYFGLSAGSHTVSVSSSVNQQYFLSAISYNGVSQSGLDATNYLDQTTNTTNSITTSADNSWVVNYATNDDTVFTAGSGAHQIGSNSNHLFFDSNAAVHPAGSYSMTITGPSRATDWFMFSLAPAAGSSAATTPINFFDFF